MDFPASDLPGMITFAVLFLSGCAGLLVLATLAEKGIRRFRNRDHLR